MYESMCQSAKRETQKTPQKVRFLVNKKLLVTIALLVVTMFAIRNHMFFRISFLDSSSCTCSPHRNTSRQRDTSLSRPCRPQMVLEWSDDIITWTERIITEPDVTQASCEPGRNRKGTAVIEFEFPKLHGK